MVTTETRCRRCKAYEDNHVLIAPAAVIDQGYHYTLSVHEFDPMGELELLVWTQLLSADQTQIAIHTALLALAREVDELKGRNDG